MTFFPLKGDGGKMFCKVRGRNVVILFLKRRATEGRKEEK